MTTTDKNDVCIDGCLMLTALTLSVANTFMAAGLLSGGMEHRTGEIVGGLFGCCVCWFVAFLAACEVDGRLLKANGSR